MRIPAKEWRKMNMIAQRVNKWTARVEKGKERETLYHQQLTKAIEPYLTKKGMIRKIGLKKTEIEYLTKKLTSYTTSKYATQKKRAELYKKIHEKTVKTLSTHELLQESEDKQATAEKAIALFQLFIKDTDIMSFFYLSSDQVLEMASEYGDLKTSDIQKLAEYIEKDRQDKYPTFLQQVQYIDDDKQSLNDLLEIMKAEGFKSADMLIKNIDRIKKDYDKYEKRVLKGEKLADIIAEERAKK